MSEFDSLEGPIVITLDLFVRRLPCREIRNDAMKFHGQLDPTRDTDRVSQRCVELYGDDLDFVSGGSYLIRTEQQNL